jgi:hypothetical protein
MADSIGPQNNVVVFFHVHQNKEMATTAAESLRGPEGEKC